MVGVELKYVREGNTNNSCQTKLIQIHDKVKRRI